MKKWLWLCFIWLTLGELIAQGNSAFFHHLTIEDGLTDGVNYFVTKDTRGFVWISSVRGLNRYDGSQVKTYLPGTERDSTSLFGENIQSRMFEVENGDLWFTTYEGVNLYRRKTDDFWHTTFVDENGVLLTGYHAFHLDNQGMLWIIVDNKSVHLYDTKARKFHFKHSLAPETYRAALVIEDDGNIIGGYYSSGGPGPTLTRIVYLPDGTIELDTRKIIYSEDTLYAIQILPENDTLIWLATRIGLLAYNWENQHILRYVPHSSASSVSCNALAEYDSDNLLLAFEIGRASCRERV